MYINVINYDDVRLEKRLRPRKDDPNAAAWQSRAKNLLKSELRRRGISYAELVRRLGDMGVQETERNLTNKISRGGFSAAFLLLCLAAVEAKELHLN